jgi:Arc/MetJ family transcription regulator
MGQNGLHTAEVGGSSPLARRAEVCQIIWHTVGMRTTLELDDVLLASLMARLPGVSKTEAIQRAVRFYLTHDAVDQLRQLAGTVEIDDVSRHLRGTDRTT